MTTFLRLPSERDKAEALMAACHYLRHGENDPRSFGVALESFGSIPSKPFAYWIGESVRRVFHQLPAVEGAGRTIKQGLATGDDFGFVRFWLEFGGPGCFGSNKGGAFSPIYADVYLLVNWSSDSRETKHNLSDKAGVRPTLWMLRDTVSNRLLRSGLTWTLRSQIGFGMRVMSAGCVFGHTGLASLSDHDYPEELFALQMLSNSRTFRLRNKGAARSRDEEKQFEALQSFEVELVGFRDTLLKMAPTYKHNQTDGAQAGADRLWSLLRHKPWQKMLKDTWVKLEKGSYNRAHLTMNYWPGRVRETCKTAKSFAVAHGLEALMVEPIESSEDVTQ